MLLFKIKGEILIKKHTINAISNLIYLLLTDTVPAYTWDSWNEVFCHVDYFTCKTNANQSSGKLPLLICKITETSRLWSRAATIKRQKTDQLFWWSISYLKSGCFRASRTRYSIRFFLFFVIVDWISLGSDRTKHLHHFELWETDEYFLNIVWCLLDQTINIWIINWGNQINDDGENS